MKKITHIIKRLFVIFFFVYIGLGIVLFVFQSGYIFYADTTDFNNCPAFDNAEKVSFGSTRGYLTKKSKDKVIVYYHGNAGRACDRGYLNPTLTEGGYSTFFVEYSGYADKSGNASMTALLKNVDDTISFLKAQKFKDVVVVGESIGVGPAAYHASRSTVDKLILITAYNNLASVAFSHYPVYPMNILLRNNFTPDKWLSQFKGKVSMILAENDETIPNKFGKKLYEGIPSDQKSMYIVKNTGHNDIYDQDEFYTFLKASLK